MSTEIFDTEFIESEGAAQSIIDNAANDDAADDAASEEDFINETYTSYSADENLHQASYASTSDSGSSTYSESYTDQSFNFALIFVVSMLVGLGIFSLLSRRW